MLNQAHNAPAEQESEILPEKLPLNLKDEAIKLAQQHRRSLQDISDVRKSPPSRHVPQAVVLQNRFPHLNDNLKEAVARLQALSTSVEQVTSASEWILDNYYIASFALREVKEDLPSNYEQQLPRLPSGIPRVYDLGMSIVKIERVLLDLEHVERFVDAYQEVNPLSMGELWALPIMLRFSILECLVGAVSRLSGTATKPEQELVSSLDFLEPLDDSLIVENSIRSLRTLSVYDWKHFFESLSLVDGILAQDPVDLYSGLDFDTRDQYRKAVEEYAFHGHNDELAVARAALNLARSAGKAGQPARPLQAEPGIAKNISSGWDGFKTQPEEHIGYYLLGQGRDILEKEIRYTPSGRARFEHFIHHHPTFFYLGTIGALTLGLIIFSLIVAANTAISILGLLLVFFLSLVPAMTIGVDLANWLITKLIKTHSLPRMDFSHGLPQECATLVVIPAMLTEDDEIDALVNQLEQHYLRNPDPQLFFALVTDFGDAPQKHQPDDDSLIKLARRRINELNNKYFGKEPRLEEPRLEEPRLFKPGRFALLHRERIWNPSEGVWMGWERKRGKLHELNSLILDAQGVDVGRSSDEETRSYFPIREGDFSMLQHVRYVITLDSDTILPREAACELIAVLAHPLNRARLEPAGADGCGEKVVSGYTILQPRTEINPLSASKTPFARIFSGDTGLDLYTRAVSDVYQDIFGEGSYVGKGAYEVVTFERSLRGCIPENTLLSHDLFEGIHGRAALEASTILIENIPPTYLVHTRRMHRWIRGDWQLLPWLFSKRLSPISRWKILDNLRRSLVPGSLVLWFLSGWLVQPLSPAVWTISGALVLAISVLTGILAIILKGIQGQPSSQNGSALKTSFYRWLIALVFLPYEAQLAANAIFKTLVRMTITHRNLLRWTTSEQVERRMGDRSILATWLQLKFSPILAIIAGILIFFINPVALFWAAPFLAAWFLAPLIATWISRPIIRREVKLSSDQIRKLRSLARQTWLFFEQFIGPEDQWLPPDHFQESPLGIVAHRTSPTNIGLALLSTLGAYDLGYLDLQSLSTRLNSSLDTLEKMERYRGHFLNWYDTRRLEPLQPRYVSTVDSGNLAACLLTLHQGCVEIRELPVFSWNSFEGLIDSFALLDSFFQDLDTPSMRQKLQNLRNALNAIMLDIKSAEGTPSLWPGLVKDLEGNGNQQVSRHSWPDLDQLIVDLVEEHATEIEADKLRNLRYVNRGARQQLTSLQRSIDLLLPWLNSFERVPALFNEATLPLDLAETWHDLQLKFPLQLSLTQIPKACQDGSVVIKQLSERLQERNDPIWRSASQWLDELEANLESARASAETLLATFEELVEHCEKLFQEMDFAFLFNAQRKVFHIGYNVTTSSLDLNFYDLLASEARLASLVAISKGEVPQSHWLHLSRPFTQVDGHQALISWSATMFEYLMPDLLVHSEPATLLGQTNEAVVNRQIEYGREKTVPWGISESGYYRFDANQFYQYRAFGVPGLGYKRGLADDLVISPYASLIALAWQPDAVVQNIERLKKLGMLGTFGFYEAADFTPARLALGQEMAIVQSYMAHHQGMIMLSMVNYLHQEAMIRRFQSDPRIQSINLLLLEQIPRDAPLEKPSVDGTMGLRLMRSGNRSTPWQVDPQAPQPRVHYLSNGRYGVMITAAGGGYSTWEDVDLTRWQPDTTRDHLGSWIYVKDRETGSFWSASLQPTHNAGDEHEVFFSSHLAEFRRRDGSLAQVTEVFVAPEHDVEVRLLTLTNHGDDLRRLRLTSYGEVVLSPQLNDARHPAFNKLFIESEPLPKNTGLLFHRRPRSKSEDRVYLAHSLVNQPAEVTLGLRSLENDRGRFVGRNTTTRDPAAMNPDWQPASGSSPDPIFSISQDVDLPPHSTMRLAYLTAASQTKEGCLAILDRYASMRTIERALERARALAEVEMNELEISTSQIEEFQTLLSLLVYPSCAMRPNPERLAANQKGQPGLWAFGISGDYPILLAEIYSEQELSIVQELFKAHTYWRRRHLMIDLVLLDRLSTSYNQNLRLKIDNLLKITSSEGWVNARGGIFTLHAAMMNEDDLTLLETASRVVLDSSRETLAEHLQHRPALSVKPSRLPPFIPAPTDGIAVLPTEPLVRPQGLLYDNGLGGFSPDGKEYAIYLEHGKSTPSPWVNVVANPDFGFLATEAGMGLTWSENSSENKLTPWSNDPISNEAHEALYLRDEETAQIWSPTPQPAPGPEPYLVRHGAGYTIYENNNHGLCQRLRLFTPPDAPLKILHLRLENSWDRHRRITATYYVEWVLGVIREITQPYIIPEYSSDPQALLARDPYHPEFARRIAFVAASNPLHGLTCDRTEFLGRLGSPKEPAALKRIGLAGTVEAGLDPCAALQLHIDIQPGEVEQIFFVLGQAENREIALDLVRRFQDAQEIEAAWESNQRLWDNLLGTIQVHTPEPSVDLLLNRWLLYQTLSSRFWGRTGFYQSSGAYGFRDQLQDSLALLHAAPQLAREHLLRAASRQFEAGDVLHWWHPPSGRGLRTRISDNLLWLPYIAVEYVRTTGDESILNEKIPFLQASQLEIGQNEVYGQFSATSTAYTFFEHCRRALEKGTTSGPHNLPLMGSGDWNDGMNLVGNEGRGESIWLGWFLYSTLNRFAELCEQHGHEEPAAGYHQAAADLAKAIERSAWDGQWYLRAFYDDGTPLGSSTNRECQIDSIAQSWSVLSGGGDPQHAAQAMQSVLDRLVQHAERLVLLLTPPFNKTPRDPGYIKGYPPGVRENGGQYTHAALWSAWALLESGRIEEGFDVFQLLNPILHADTPEKSARYRVEPYVVAADVYGAAPFTGMGGWTWYTGSSGWMYRLGLEGLLGLKKVGSRLHLDPHIPRAWTGFQVTYRFGQATYEIEVQNPKQVNQGVQEVSLNGQVLVDKEIPLSGGIGLNKVQVKMG